ncbi:MAG: porin [Dyella sp.]|uniref:porin n=1 Tax=Dyella sp. TaxID=1869338 RepID=UPI003F7E6D77
MTFRPRLLSLAVAGALLGGVSLAAQAADTVSNAELLKLVRQQAAEIQALKTRLSRVEAHEAAPVADAGTGAASPLQAQAAEGHAQAQAALDDTRGAELALAQAQLATGGGTGGGHRGDIRWGKGGESGPTFTSDDGFFSFKPDGRLLADFTGTKGSNYPDRNIAGNHIASARLGGEGTIGAFGYHVEAEFSDNAAALHQAYLSYTTNQGGLRTRYYLGNFLKDIGTEGSSESARVPFMLRNAPTQVAQPVNSYFGTGAQVKLWGSNWHYSLSVTGDSPSSDTKGDSPDSIVYLSRAHWNPLKGGWGFVHAGAWYYYENISRAVTSINNVPKLALDYNANIRVSGSSIDNPTQDRGRGFELGGTYRNFWLMNEYGRQKIDSSTDPSVVRHGSSYAAGWMITGEKPGFSSHSGTWQAVKVNAPVTSGGWGAWELAARVDHYDYHGAPRGGDGRSYTLGVNWYLNDWSRLMLDYVRWYTDNQVGSYKGPDWGNSLGIRAQVVF